MYYLFIFCCGFCGDFDCITLFVTCKILIAFLSSFLAILILLIHFEKITNLLFFYLAGFIVIILFVFIYYC